MKKQLSTRQLKKKVRKECPNAINIQLGSNGSTFGVWYETPFSTHRKFISA